VNLFYRSAFFPLRYAKKGEAPSLKRVVNGL
jgi:hypothetical protein